jgi:hypothetical protein
MDMCNKKINVCLQIEEWDFDDGIYEQLQGHVDKIVELMNLLSFSLNL